MNKNKRNKMILIIGSAILIITFILLFLLIGRNHQENMQIIEGCFDHFDQSDGVVLEKTNFWSPVTCEKK